MYKKVLSAALAIILCTSLFCGCMSGQDMTAKTAAPLPETPAPTPTQIIPADKNYIDTDGIFEYLDAVSSDLNAKKDFSYCIINRYYISRLSDEAQRLCVAMYCSVLRFEERCEFDATVDYDTFNTAIQVLMHDCPELFMLDTQFSYTTFGEDAEKPAVSGVNFSYTMTAEQYRQALSDVVNSIEQWGIKTTSDAFDTEKLIYDKVLESCTYSLDSAYNGTSYGGIVLGEALCAGYTYAFNFSLLYHGISAFMVTGIAYDEQGKGESHSWSCVELNGQFFYCDATWDDYDTAGSDSSNYAFFNITTDELLRTREISDVIDIPLPQCDSVEYSYYTKNGLYIHIGDDVKELFTIYMNSLAENKIEKASIKFETLEQYKLFYDNFADWMNDWSAQNSIGLKTYSWIPVESAYVICLTNFTYKHTQSAIG